MNVEFRRRAVAEHNEITGQLAKAFGTLFYDLAETMPGGLEYYLDGVHMSLAGTNEMARQIAEYLVASGRMND